MWLKIRTGPTQTKMSSIAASNMKVNELHYPRIGKISADQLRSYCEADLRLCFRYAKCVFSHGVAHVTYVICCNTESI